MKGFKQFNMPLPIRINDEVSQLDSVIIGIGHDQGGPTFKNPKTLFHLEHDSYPTQADIQSDIDHLAHALMGNGIKVFRPVNIKNHCQIFTRDLGFVIGDEFYIAALSPGRSKEAEGIRYLIDLMDPAKIIDVSLEKNVSIEGGDVVVRNNTVFVGYGERTNNEGFEFLRERLKGKKEVVQVKLISDNKNHFEHSLHLDCAFQPVGHNHAIIYEEAIKNIGEFYKHLSIPEENIYKANEWQFVRMFPNIFSISPDTVMIETEFIELKIWLQERGFKVIEIDYKETSKLSGLLRCSTLPLFRK